MSSSSKGEHSLDQGRLYRIEHRLKVSYVTFGRPHVLLKVAYVTLGNTRLITGIAQWLNRRTRDRKVPGSSPGRSGGRIFVLQGKFSVLNLISVSEAGKFPQKTNKQ